MTNYSDITIKKYTRGNLAGKIAMFFNTEDAKRVYTRTVNNDLFCLAYEYSDSVMQKAEDFCTAHRLHYEIIIS